MRILAVLSVLFVVAPTEAVDKRVGIDLNSNSVTLERKPGKNTAFVTADTRNADGAISGGYVGFKIGNAYYGKKARICARVTVDEGGVWLLLDVHAKAPVAQTKHVDVRGDHLLELVTTCPREGHLVACVGLTPGAKVRVLLLSIEYAE